MLTVLFNVSFAILCHSLFSVLNPASYRRLRLLGGEWQLLFHETQVSMCFGARVVDLDGDDRCYGVI